jgi:hypothetical protein
MYAGMPVVLNDTMPIHPDKYIPPEERFFEYSKAEYVWLKYFGYGKTVTDYAKLNIVRVSIRHRECFMMHPEVWEHIKLEIGRRS